MDSLRLADDPRRFRILSIDPPTAAGGRYRISLQSEDGLATVLNCDGEEFVTVWVREVACPYRPEPVLPGPRHAFA